MRLGLPDCHDVLPQLSAGLAIKVGCSWEQARRQVGEAVSGQRWAGKQVAGEAASWRQGLLHSRGGGSSATQLARHWRLPPLPCAPHHGRRLSLGIGGIRGRSGGGLLHEPSDEGVQALCQQLVPRGVGVQRVGHQRAVDGAAARGEEAVPAVDKVQAGVQAGVGPAGGSGGGVDSRVVVGG